MTIGQLRDEIDRLIAGGASHDTPVWMRITVDDDEEIALVETVRANEHGAVLDGELFIDDGPPGDDMDADPEPVYWRAA